MEYGNASGAVAGYATNGPTIAPPKQSAMHEHSARLHDLATRLSQCNERLSGIINRAFGPEPQAAAKEVAQPNPNGVLYVAQFGAERIGMEIERLSQQIAKLEQIA